ncbi:unnamed protein product [Brassica oleracea]
MSLSSLVLEMARSVLPRESIYFFRHVSLYHLVYII